MKKILFRSLIISLGAFLFSGGAMAQELSVGDYNLVESKRVSRTETQYTYTLEILNNETVLEAINVTATLSSNSSYTTVVDGTVEVDSIPASGSVTSTDTFSIKQNRRATFNPSDLVWDIQSEAPSTAPLVEITSPEDGMTSGSPTVILRGKISDPSITKIIISSSVDGRPIFSDASAHIQGEDFAFIPPLRAGDNILTIVSTNSSGESITETLTIHEPEAVFESISVSTIPEIGILSSTEPTVDIRLRATEYLKNPIISYSWDFDGDGVADKQETIPPTHKSFFREKATYSNTGLYFPTMTATDEEGQTFTGTGIVNILSLEQVKIPFQQIVSSLRNSLISGDIDKAVSLFYPLSQDEYREMFESFSASDRNALAEEFGDVRFVKLYGGRAEFEIITEREDGNTYSFPIFFVDYDGWKIKQF